MNSGGEKENLEQAVPGASPASREQEAGSSIEQDTAQFSLPLSTGSHAMMRAEELDHEGTSSDEVLAETLEVTRDEATQTASDEIAPRPIMGARLRAAREGLGLSRAEAATKLRLPLRLIARLEDDDYEGMDQGVYLRGYLSSYARLVGVSIEEAEHVAAVHTRTAPLVATGTVSRSRYLFDRYSVSATYVILTGLIVLPAVWLATHGGLEQNLARTTPLDGSTTITIPPAATDDNAASTESSDATTETPPPATETTTTSVAAIEPPKQEQMPVVASMTPFAAQPAAAQPAPETPAPAKSGAHTLTLKLSAASWVEITGTDGSKLEYGLLAAGTVKTYSSDGALSIRLGNADGTEVKVDGTVLDLAPFRRANVARLRVFGGNGTEAPRTDF